MIAHAKDFQRDSATYRDRFDTRAFIRRALRGYEVKRDENKARFQDWQAARTAAAAIKTEAVGQLGTTLARFIENAEARGTKVFVASNGARAKDYIIDVIRRHNAKSIVKSKSMTGEEIHLTQALEQEGFEVVESDLGEFIVQLRHEAPFHIVFPAMHLKRDEISRLFEEKLGSAHTDSPEELTMIARRAIRQKYCTADIGISGVNFAVAETGTIAMCTNEGNGRLTTSLPRIHIALMGIEKVIPRLEDLALLLPMLAVAGSGQHLTCYNNLISGPRRPGESDGPEEFHLVIMDNARTTLLADAEQRDALNCIRCGACLNVCPVYKNVGGHTYGTTYPGPIGSVITPHLRGLQSWKHLSAASSLCGACTDACPVKIDLHHHLLHNRRNAIQGKKTWWEALLFRGFGFVASDARLFALAGKLGRLFQPLHGIVSGTPLDPLIHWTGARDLPSPPPEAFRDWWAARQKNPPAS